MRTRLVLATLPVALLSVAVAPSFAAPKKIEKSYTASATPDPSSNATDPCEPLTPSAMHKTEVTIPAAGRFAVTMTGFLGDWDLCVYGKGGDMIGSSTGSVDATTETVDVKIKKATTVTIVAQNGGGSPTASVKYVFTYK